MATPSQHELNTLTAISPLDGRYWAKTCGLSSYFSEYSLHRYRVRVEVEYFIALCELPLPQLQEFPKSLYDELRKLYKEFSDKDAFRIKEIEEVTKHDVKAVEYFVKENMDRLKISEQFREFIHFALTSQDINNTAIPMALKDAVSHLYVPTLLHKVIEPLRAMAEEWKTVPMLARTHGQAATPTRVGKELMVFVERLEKQLDQLVAVPFSAKFGGATGQFNAHFVAFPMIDWPTFADKFVVSILGLTRRSQYTTQIDHYDDIAALLHAMERIHNILVDLCRDMWTYISLDYFRMKVVKTEVGSSAMPHKVNPIDFENAEGNLGMANAVLAHLAAKLPISRLQRDLTDSTALRNLGVPFGHALVAFDSLRRGLDKLILHTSTVYEDLEHHWVVIAEAIQTVLRREGYPRPYEALKELTRTEEAGEKVTRETFLRFIDGLQGVSENVKQELREITPFTFIGGLPRNDTWRSEQ